MESPRKKNIRADIILLFDENFRHSFVFLVRFNEIQIFQLTFEFIAFGNKPSKHMTSKGRWVLVDFWSRRHITNIQRHSDVKMKRLINVGF